MRMNLLVSFVVSIAVSASPITIFAEEDASPSSSAPAASTPASSSADAGGSSTAPVTSIIGTKKNYGEIDNSGRTEAAEKFNQMVIEVNNAASQANSAGGSVDMNLHNKLKEASSTYSGMHGSCVKTQATASWWCREETSPNLQKTLNDVNVVGSLLIGAAVKDSCSNFGKVAKIAQAGLTAYTASCSTARAACDAACSAVKSNLDRIKAIEVSNLQCGTMGPPLNESIQACNNLNSLLSKYAAESKNVIEPDSSDKVPNSIARKKTACSYEYTNMLISAGTGIASMINSFKQGQSCDKATNGTSSVADLTVKDKCLDAANATLPECICKANPRTPGCANTLDKPGDSGGASGLNATASGGRGLTSDSGAINIGSGDLPLGEAGKNEASGGSGAAGAPVGGGGGSAGLGGGGGGSGKGLSKEEAAKTGLNANIISSGGGGGGGSWGGGGSGSGSEKYRAYLPGGAKDPNKGLAGQQSWSREVTGQGGKSNFEKVKDRYIDNKGTLINN